MAVYAIIVTTISDEYTSYTGTSQLYAFTTERPPLCYKQPQIALSPFFTPVDGLCRPDNVCYANHSNNIGLY